jgi:hypothetical protein
VEHLFIFIILAVAAEIIGTIGGFGSSMLFVPLAGFFFDFHSVLGITALFHLASNISKIALFRRGFNKKLILNIGIPSVLFVIIGAYISKFFDGRILEIILAYFLISLSALLFIFKNTSLRPTWFNSMSGGALSGFAAGLVGTGGAIRGLTLAAFSLEKNTFVATSAVIDLGIDLSRTVVYASNGYLHKDDLYLAPILIGVGFFGSYLGKKLLAYFSEPQFKATTLFLIFAIGITTLLKQL